MSAVRRKPINAPLPGVLVRSCKRRPSRVADEIRREVAALLLNKINDPRVVGVTVLNVSLSSDLSQARIYYSVLNQAAAADAAKGLTSAKGFIRSGLARGLALRVVPNLIFELDHSLAEQEKMERIFREIRAEAVHDDEINDRE